jgi:pyridoxamine 5'-phosphate oxidase-like protein
VRHHLALRPKMGYAEDGFLCVRATINLEEAMFQWANFEAVAPTLAAQGRELIEHFRFVLVGTIRRDGTPRMSPVEARLVRGHLMLVMIPGTLKVRDLLRDPRILVNSPITHPDDPNREFKLRGRVIEIQDPELREATASAIEATSGWRPPDGWHFFALDIQEAAFLAWQHGILDLTSWDRDRGLDSVRRPIAVLDEPDA